MTSFISLNQQEESPLRPSQDKPELPPYKKENVGNDIYGEKRLVLAKIVGDFFKTTDITWFLDGGTLLGAYRNGSFIAHDDDFDTAIYFPQYRGPEDLGKLKRELEEFLPDPYAVRLVTSYAHKLEVFDKTSRQYKLPEHFYKGANFHTVTVDLQVMTDKDDSVVYLHDLLEHVKVPKATIEPTGKIQCEGITFNSPHLVNDFLKALYGYIGEDSKYDPKTKLYVKKLSKNRES
jgi:hypothetical protein